MGTTALMLSSTRSSQGTLARKVVTPRNSIREMAALEAAMQGLVLDDRHPVALEIAGTSDEQMWIIRATTEAALDHATRQIRARYPQVEFIDLEKGEDPFRLEKGETVSVIELVAGAVAYVPMRSWDEKSLTKEGTDPLLSVLATIGHLPVDLRAIAQLSIVPAPVNWAGPAGSRKAVEHPLEEEREQRRAQSYEGGTFKWSTIIGLASILFGLYLWRILHVTLPSWFVAAMSSLLHGHFPTLSGSLQIQFYGGIAGVFVGLFFLYVLYDQVRKRLKQKRLYDQRMVNEKVGQIACRVRLRLYVTGPGPKRRLASYCWKKGRALLWAGLCGCWFALRFILGWLWRFLLPIFRIIRHPLLTAKAVRHCIWSVLRSLRHPLVLWNRFRTGFSHFALWIWKWLGHPSVFWNGFRTGFSRFALWIWGWLRHPVQSVQRIRFGLVRFGLWLLKHEFIRLAYELGRDLWEERCWRKGQAERRDTVLQSLIAAYRQFSRGSGGHLLPRRISSRGAHRLMSLKQRGILGRYGWERGVQRSTHYWSMEELAGAWHLLQALDLPYAGMVDIRAARTLPISPDVAALAQGGPIIGRAKHGEHSIPFSYTEEWLRLHALILGKSGEGKSSFLVHVAQAAMQTGGMIFIDPPGDSVPRILRMVPPHRRKDVVVIDLSDPFYSVGLNPLDVTLGRGRDKAIADLLETLSHIWMRSWGSRMENSFEFALRTAWEANKYLVNFDSQNGPDKQFTLLDILPLYTNESYCNSLLQFVTDPYVIRWWNEFYKPLPLYMKRDIINPVATKVAKFESEIARRIVGQPRSKINLTEIIRQKKILLIRLAKGTVGADAAPLLGATLLGLISVCLEEQGAIAEEERALFPILIDEFQVLEGVDWSMLAQLRKYGATFFLATQSLEYLQRLDPLLLPTVLANIRQIYCFNTSAQDAWTIHRELGVEPDDIVNLDSHMCYVKLKSGVRRRPTFSLNIEPPPAIGEEQVAAAEEIWRSSQTQFATPAAEVDDWLRRSTDARGNVIIPNVRVEAEGNVVQSVPLSQFPSQLPPVPPADARVAKTHAPRVRGQGSKKPEVATTPDGVPRSRPRLFAGKGKKGGDE